MVVQNASDISGTFGPALVPDSARFNPRRRRRMTSEGENGATTGPLSLGKILRPAVLPHLGAIQPGQTRFTLAEAKALLRDLGYP